MIRAARWIALGVVPAIALVVAGCSTTKTGSVAAPPGDTAIMCSKCETVWVRRADKINKTTVYRREEKMVCPDCESAVATFFKTGKLEHVCKSCGGTLDHCTVHDEPVAQAQSTVPAVAEEQAAICTKCKEIWVMCPHQVGSKATIYRKEKKMVCPDCEFAVESFFTTGKFEHTCKSCGDALSACKLCQ